MKRLSPRLKEAAALVRKVDTIADVGTDHAYLPIYLIEHGVCRRVIASDLRTGPLENARANVEAAGLSERIELRLSDGLTNYRPNEAQDIVIAGMGGILIAEILDKAEWLRHGDRHLVLQPMTHAEVLRAYLMANGYRILRESVCEDGGNLYCFLSCAHTDKPQKYDAFYEYYGELPNSSDRLAGVYLRRLKDRCLREAAAVGDSDRPRADRLRRIAQKLESLLTDQL